MKSMIHHLNALKDHGTPVPLDTMLASYCDDTALNMTFFPDIHRTIGTKTGKAYPMMMASQGLLFQKRQAKQKYLPSPWSFSINSKTMCPFSRNPSMRCLSGGYLFPVFIYKNFIILALSIPLNLI